MVKIYVHYLHVKLRTSPACKISHISLLCKRHCHRSSACKICHTSPVYKRLCCTSPAYNFPCLLSMRKKFSHIAQIIKKSQPCELFWAVLLKILPFHHIFYYSSFSVFDSLIIIGLTTQKLRGTSKLLLCGWWIMCVHVL